MLFYGGLRKYEGLWYRIPGALNQGRGFRIRGFRLYAFRVGFATEQARAFAKLGCKGPCQTPEP